MIVGWDMDKLIVEEISKVMIEIVVENIVDGVIVLFFYLFIGGLVFVLMYKVVNILDLMVGYKNEKYCVIGFVFVKMDDIVNFILVRLVWFFFVIVSFILRYDGCVFW